MTSKHEIPMAIGLVDRDAAESAESSAPNCAWVGALPLKKAITALTTLNLTLIDYLLIFSLQNLVLS